MVKCDALEHMLNKWQRTSLLFVALYIELNSFGLKQIDLSVTQGLCRDVAALC